MSGLLSQDFACADCQKSDAEIEECRIYQYKFKVFGKRCPRQGLDEPKVLAEDVAGDQYLELPLELIYWREPIRTAIKQEDIQNMAVSLRVHKQIQPVVVKPADENGMYEGVVGRLRYEGAKHARLRSILARVHRFESSRQVLEWQLAENAHRRDLTEIERDDALARLHALHIEEKGGVYDKAIVSSIAKTIEEQTGEKPSEKTIWQRIEIAKTLPEEVKKTLNVKSFGVGHGVQLLRLKDEPEKQLQLASEFANSAATGKPMTVKKFKERVDEVLGVSKPRALPEITCIVCGKPLSEAKLRERLELIKENMELYEPVRRAYEAVLEKREG
ncbi:MAG: ParB/RepB/Spo0J family partition protein [Candidatus Brockarchaeota archaeon]|nr:ParB/RepB/Spo0J family partition protein [Candidatus Brockarchaeota archaeon]